MAEIYDTNYSKLSHGEYILVLYMLAEKLRDHIAFQNLPEHVPGSPKFLDYAEQMKIAVEEAKSRDVNKGARRDWLRARSQQDITFVGQHVVMVATHRNDPTILEGTGLKLKTRSYTKTQHSDRPDRPDKLKVTNGKDPGTVVALVSRVPGPGGIELHWTDGDPADESSWRNAGMFYQCRIELKGLDSVKRYYFRVRYHTTSGVGPWSAIMDLVVV